MANRKDNPMTTACTEWEMQLAEALDGVLAPEKQLSFHAHKTTCAACADLYEQARRGQEWLGFLSEEPEVPEGLLERILISTGPGATQFNALAPALAGGVIQMPPVWQRPNFMARATRFASQHFDTRIMLTAAMAFFSIALTLNLSGFRLDRIHMGWITPNYVRAVMERRVTAASSPIVRYYDHVRDSYAVDSKVRVIKKTTEGLTAPLKNQAEPESTPGDNSPETDQKKQPGHDGAQMQLPGKQVPSAALKQTNLPTSKQQERNHNTQSSANQAALAL
jgi:hypothetical protein